MILVTSAAGQTGTRIIKHLAARGVRVAGYAKRPESARLVESLGAEARRGDLRDPEALARAMADVKTLYHIAPTLTYLEHDMGRGVLEAAKRAGVERIVLHGVIAPYLQNINYHFAKELVQWDLYRSGLAYTVLLPTNFMQNVNWTWPAIAEHGEWPLPYDPDKKLTWVDLDDVAEAAANVLVEEGHEYGTYELCGTDSFLSRNEIARVMSSALGRPVRATKVPIDDYLDRYRSMPFFSRMTSAELDQIKAMFIDYDRYGMPAGNPRVLSMLLGRPAASYAQFVERLAKASRPGASTETVTTYGMPAMT